MTNLAGRPEVSDIQQTLMGAMQEKMILDSDFVPPVITEGPARRPGQKK